MYVNTLISLQENIPTYGVEGKTVTGHVTISTPGIIKCYVQNLKQTNNRKFELYVISSKQNTGVKIGELGEEKETKWRVDEQNVMGGTIALKDIDGVAIIVKENELRGVDAILLGFKNERFTILPILESIVPRPQPVEVKVQPKQEEKKSAKPKETSISQTQRPIEGEKKQEIVPGQNGVEKEEDDEVIKGILGKVIGKPILEGKIPGGNVLEYPSPEDPDVKATEENNKKVIKEPSAENIQDEFFPQGPGPVIPPKPPQPGQGPGPAMPPKPPQPGQGPGPAIPPKPPQQGPGPVIPPKPPQQGPGPAIPPKPPQSGPKPVILPNGQVYIPQGPGPVIIPNDEPEEGTGSVIPNPGKPKKPCNCGERNDSLTEEMERSKAAIEKLTEKIRKAKELTNQGDNEKEQEEVWHLEVDRGIQDIEAESVKIEETTEEIDYLVEIEKKLKEIQGRLKNVRNDEYEDEVGNEADDDNREDEEGIDDSEAPEEPDTFDETEDNETLTIDKSKLDRLEIRRTQSIIGDILNKVQSLKQQGSSTKQQRSEEVEEKLFKADQQLQVPKSIMEDIYAKGEAVEAFIQEPEDTEWVRIPYGEFLKIPSLSYEWCTQPFITFAFYKYNEILLGHNGQGAYYLGIPDVYHPEREAILSEPIPVERFLCRRNIEPAIGEYGYWIIPLSK